MARTVVVGYDGSDEARGALLVAAERVGADGELILVHSMLPGAPPAEWFGASLYGEIVERANEAAEKMLEAARAELPDSLRVRTHLAGGAPAQTLAGVAETFAADEIVVGSRGLGRLAAGLGSVSHALLHLATRPVVVVPAGPPADRGATGAIVVGYDCSEPSAAALAYARRRADGGTLYVVCAAEHVPKFLGDPYRQHALDAALSRARACADEASERLQGTTFECEVLDGPAADAILRVAATRDADEIVVGSRGFGAIRGAIGSVSHDVIRAADRPVTVIPTQATG